MNVSSDLLENKLNELLFPSYVVSPMHGIGNSIFAGIVDISPELADEWLLRAGEIRWVRHSRRQTRIYERQMVSDQWVLDGSAILFDHDGNLLDGKHRLTACIRAKKSFRTLVLMGMLDPPSNRKIERRFPAR